MGSGSQSSPTDTHLMGMDDVEFESVLLAAQEGAEWAWSRLYGWLAADVRGYLRARGAPSPDDCLGDTFVHVARRIGHFEGTATGFRSWVFVIAHHRLIDAFRKAGRDRAIPTSPDDMPEGAAPVHVDAEAIALMEADELRAWLARHLTEEQRTIVALRVFGGLSLTDIAETLGKRPGAVRVAHHRAMNRLRAVAEEAGVTR